MNDPHDNAETDKAALAQCTPKPDDWKIATTYAKAQAGRFTIVSWADQRTTIATLTGPDAGRHAAAIVKDHNAAPELAAALDQIGRHAHAATADGMTAADLRAILHTISKGAFAALARAEL